MKIAVLGYSGAGKSTLAKTLAEHFDCPLLYLDRANYEAGWRERSRKEAHEIVYAFMQNEAWVIDGNYPGFYFSGRLDQADKIIILDVPRLVCFWRVLKRYFTYKNRTRESMADGCREKMDFAFMKWVLFEGRGREYKERYKKIAQTYPDKTLVLRKRQEVESAMAELCTAKTKNARKPAGTK